MNESGFNMGLFTCEKKILGLIQILIVIANHVTVKKILIIGRGLLQISYMPNYMLYH